MSKITKINVNMGWTIQTKEFESFRVNVGLTAEIDPDDDLDEVYDDLVGRIESKINKEVENHMP